MRKKILKFIILPAVLSTVYCLLSTVIFASRIDELKTNINDRNSQIAELEKEIEQYQKQIDGVLEQKKTLKNEISQLEINAKKLNTNISLTKKKIETSNLNIEKLSLEINNKTVEIGDKKIILSKIIKNVNEFESQSLVEIALANETFSDFFNDIEQMNNIQKKMNSNLNDLKELKETLGNEKTEEEIEKKMQEKLKAQLVDQKILVDKNKSAKNDLLKITKNREENYRSILEDKLAKKEEFERELKNLEDQLKIEIDPNILPPSRAGILAWPIDLVKITQYFGNTTFATQNPQVYNGGGHTGIDFRAPIGTPIKSSADGIVKGTGNTDTVRGCYSYGKWVLIEHKNGLSTLYAHLSLIKVAEGQNITTGDIVGYSGQTGYATGPHLHFTVYATQGVKITKFENSINCKNAIVPIADKKAYLNPLSYL